MGTQGIERTNNYSSVSSLHAASSFFSSIYLFFWLLQGNHRDVYASPPTPDGIKNRDTIPLNQSLLTTAFGKAAEGAEFTTDKLKVSTAVRPIANTVRPSVPSRRQLKTRFAFKVAMWQQLFFFCTYSVVPNFLLCPYHPVTLLFSSSVVVVFVRWAGGRLICCFVTLLDMFTVPSAVRIWLLNDIFVPYF